ncbi:hypothetical protein [Streptomyces ossamyceticus]|uniref:hypothetical protein n=1 Tax=Streptomyces ossamyceticus TaxID=249581 RepID=UPI0034423141
MATPTRSRIDHAQVAAQLRTRPGAWIPVGVYPASYSAASTGAHIRRAQGSFSVYTPAGAYETRTRAVEDGTLLEARYTIGAPGPTRSGRVEFSKDTERVLARIECGDIWCGPAAARVIAARAEEAYGAAWHRPAQTADEAWSDALTALRTENGADT